MTNRITKWWRNWRTKDYVKVRKYIIDQLLYNNMRMLFEDDIPRGMREVLEHDHATGRISDVGIYDYLVQMVSSSQSSRIHNEIRQILSIHIDQLKLLLPLKYKIHFSKPPKITHTIVITDKQKKRKKKIW